MNCSINLTKSDDLFGDDSYIFDVKIDNKTSIMKTSFRVYDLDLIKSVINDYYSGRNSSISTWFSIKKDEITIRSNSSTVLSDLIISGEKQVRSLVSELSKLIEH